MGHIGDNPRRIEVIPETQPVRKAPTPPPTKPKRSEPQPQKTPA